MCCTLYQTVNGHTYVTPAWFDHFISLYIEQQICYNRVHEQNNKYGLTLEVIEYNINNGIVKPSIKCDFNGLTIRLPHGVIEYLIIMKRNVMCNYICNFTATAL